MTARPVFVLHHHDEPRPHFDHDLEHATYEDDAKRIIDTGEQALLHVTREQPSG